MTFCQRAEIWGVVGRAVRGGDWRARRGGWGGGGGRRQLISIAHSNLTTLKIVDIDNNSQDP